MEDGEDDVVDVVEFGGFGFFGVVKVIVLGDGDVGLFVVDFVGGV